MTNTIPSIDILDRTGTPNKLDSLWAKRRTVLVFVRHFG